MNSSLDLIDSYIEAIAKFCNAEQVNLCLYQKSITEPEIKVFGNSEAYLPEFQSKQSLEESFKELSASQLNDGNLLVIKAQLENTYLLYLNISCQRANQNDVKALGIEEKRSKLADSDCLHNNAQWLCLGIKTLAPLPSWLLPLKNQSAEDITNEPILTKLLALGGFLIEEVEKNNRILSDPISTLSGRINFQSDLHTILKSSDVVALILINPLNFQQINKNFGHDSGDFVIAEIAANLAASVRKSDLLSRFGGALFAVGAQLKSKTEAQGLVKKIQTTLSQTKYLNSTLAPEFNFGVAIYEKNKASEAIPDPVNDLIAKADQALFAAKQEKNTNFVIWQPDQLERFGYHPDHIGNIFTADTATDYRNMLLLWDISNLIASTNQFDQLITQFVKRLAKTFDFKLAGLFKNEPSNQIKTLFSFEINSNGNIANQPSERNDYASLIEDILKQNKIVPPQLKAIGHEQRLFLVTFNENDFVFILVGDIDSFNITSDSQLLLVALVKQLGRAYSRAMLEERLNSQLLSQQQKLKEELVELKQSLNSSELHYQSNKMQTLMQQVERTAKSNITTLIIGESGTGKERLVHTIHQLGSRFNKPLVIVDCGSIPQSLVESELFGYVKGAFTGAQNNAKGRILEADGGTLMLDEIGELPLQVQAKLLRFVQEKQFTPVGGNQVITVDVKIVAVTNRELEQEVQLGNFRQDLFYRLNVAVLRPPPLRERPDDILLLAKHFLKRYSIQHEEPLKKLSDDASACLISYTWPGNVRELENKLMQASLLCNEALISVDDLNITSLNPQTIETQTTVFDEEKYLPEKQLDASSDQRSSTNSPDCSRPGELTESAFLNQFESKIRIFLTLCRSNNRLNNSPIGEWLEYDLIVKCYESNQKSIKQVALCLGLASSTIRRRINKNKSVTSVRPDEWSAIVDTLSPLYRGEIYIGQGSIKRLKMILLAEILNLHGTNPTVASTLMGMSEPTFYKWKKELLLVQ